MMRRERDVHSEFWFFRQSIVLARPPASCVINQLAAQRLRDERASEAQHKSAHTTIRCAGFDTL